jgi:hypothetical protein
VEPPRAHANRKDTIATIPPLALISRSTHIMDQVNAACQQCIEIIREISESPLREEAKGDITDIDCLRGEEASRART